VDAHERFPTGVELCTLKKEHNRSHKHVRALVGRAFTRMKTYKILRDCHLRGDGVRCTMLGIARLRYPTPGPPRSRPTSKRASAQPMPDLAQLARACSSGPGTS